VQLQYFEVRSPFGGTVGDVLVRLGDFVTATTPVTSVADADRLEVSLAVPPERARQVTLQTPIELLDGRGEVLLAARVFFIAPQADPRTQLVEVKAAFDNSLGLRPSEVVRARVVYGVREALEIPALAVVRMSGQPFAYVVKMKAGKSVVERVPVTLGALGAQAYVVEAGLQAGEAIAVSSLQALRDGLEVRPVAESEDAGAPSSPGGNP
jgi:RND family efflux transporter MFP subunit